MFTILTKNSQKYVYITRTCKYYVCLSYFSPDEELDALPRPFFPRLSSVDSFSDGFS